MKGPGQVDSAGSEGVSSPDAHDWVDEIGRAEERLVPYLPPTPLILSRHLSAVLQRTVWLKLESVQPVGAFKVRPAFNSILAHLQSSREAGVVTNSSGNFAQAVAYAASTLRVNSTIVMMRGASAFKRERTRGFGGEVVLCEDTFASRSETTERIHRESGRLLVHPFDSTESIAGNGTLGRELLAQVDGDFCLFVPISGGGLIAGTALAVKAARPGCRVLGAQAAANPSMKRSLEQGHRVRTVPLSSMADALTVPVPGVNTFPIVQRLVDAVHLVSEARMASTIRDLALQDKQVVEAGAAVSVAAALDHAPTDGRDLPIVCVLSGGNIDPAVLGSILAPTQ